MTDPISGITMAPRATTGSDAGSTSVGNASEQSLGTDTFLKLLVAQLKYQSPDSPADSTQFLAQTAQFTSVEKLSSLDSSMSSLLSGQQTLAASSMLGREVTWKGGTGVVSGVNVTAAGPVLTVGTGKDAQSVALTDVTQITTPSTTTTGA